MARDVQGERVRCILGVFKAGLVTGLGMALLDGSPHGEGTRLTKSGQGSAPSVHVGNFFEGKATGRGTRWYADGSVYTGQWHAGEYHGLGELRVRSVDEDGDVFYSGSWQNGKRHGEGRADRNDGGSYAGQWADGAPHGRGTARSAGRIYVGEVAGGVPSGHGTLTLIESGDVRHAHMCKTRSLVRKSERCE